VERDLNFAKVLNKISEYLNTVTYQGDLSDIGNEIGYILGDIIPNMNQEEIDTFITGFKHGVSLTNGTHH
jgi:hypothetical protein